MGIEKVFGIQATSLSLSERFTILAKRSSFQNRRNRLSNRNQLANNQVLKARQQAFNRQRQQFANSGTGLRRYGSETNVSNLTRSNSFGNLSQRSFNSQGRRNFRGNLSRSASFSNLSQFGRQMYQEFRRGGRMARGRTRGVMRGGKMVRPFQRQNQNGRGNRGGNRGYRGRGRGRGMSNRNQLAKPLPSKEELDQQLEQYMSSTPTALDKDLDDYMKSAMELEELL